MGSKEYIHIIAEKLGTAILKFDGPIYDDYCRLVHEGHTYRITSSLSVEKACNGLLYSDEDSMKLEMMLKSKGWDGEGLPPVGCECEFKANDGGWGIGTVLCVGRNRIFWLCHEDGDEYTSEVNPQEFHPIRSEADKKRDEAAEAIDCWMPALPPTPNKFYHAKKIYDAIAAGKIPHIRID